MKKTIYSALMLGFAVVSMTGCKEAVDALTEAQLAASKDAVESTDSSKISVPSTSYTRLDVAGALEFDTNILASYGITSNSQLGIANYKLVNSKGAEVVDAVVEKTSDSNDLVDYLSITFKTMGIYYVILDFKNPDGGSASYKFKVYQTFSEPAAPKGWALEIDSKGVFMMYLEDAIKQGYANADALYLNSKSLTLLNKDGKAVGYNNLNSADYNKGGLDDFAVESFDAPVSGTVEYYDSKKVAHKISFLISQKPALWVARNDGKTWQLIVSDAVGDGLVAKDAIKISLDSLVGYKGEAVDKAKASYVEFKDKAGNVNQINLDMGMVASGFVTITGSTATKLNFVTK